MMDHPNIAKVLDGGATENGMPFFVMEYVKGIPLTRYCDEGRLSIAERLALFVPVCQAIQHAHQKGIIHRDLKPSNILVCLYDGHPVPKVIDFGLAKAMHQPLTERTLHTAHGTMMGTPLYMSPEQAEFNNLDVDTRTDVYSLGVILYELLTGSTPLERKRFKEAAWFEMLRLIKEEEPPKPSARLSGSGTLPSIAAQRKLEPARLTKLVRGELDWIVMKALEKDRARRYETANGFARDVQRYLADEPVEACPPSRGYRLRKFARKNWAALSTVAAVLLILACGVGISTWMAVRALEAEVEAAVDRDKAQKAEAEAKDQGAKAVQAASIATENEGRANHAVEDLKYTLALDRIVLAQAAFNSFTGRDLLQQVPAGLRKWDWHYLQRQYYGGIFTLYGHLAPVIAVAYSPDATRIATGSPDRTAKVWDARTGELLLELKGHGQAVTSIAFSQDSLRLVTGSFDKTARVWDARSGMPLLEVKDNPALILTVAFSPDGKRLVTGCTDNKVRYWDASTGAKVSELSLKRQLGSPSGIAFSPDESRLVTGNKLGRTAQVWDARTGAQLFELKGHSNIVYSVAFSPDGTRIATGSNDHSAKVWDAQTGKPLLDLKGHAGHIKSLAFSPDGMRLVTGSWDQTAKVWDAHTGAHLLDLKGHDGDIYSVAFSPDGARVLTGAGDYTATTWDSLTGTPVLELKSHTSFIYRVAFSPDGTRLITASADQTAKVWDARNGSLLLDIKGHGGWVGCAAFSPDGTRIATGSSGTFSRGWPGSTVMNSATIKRPVKIWDAVSGKHLLDLEGHLGGVLALAFSPDGKRLLTGGWDKTATVWDMQTGAAILCLNKHRAAVWSVAYSPDGMRLATGSEDLTAKVWDAATGTLVHELKGHSGPIAGLSFSANGELLATASWDQTARTWNVRTGALTNEHKGHTGWTISVAFSPDGTRLVTGNADRTAKVWDTRTGIPLVDLKGNQDKINDAAFSPDGARIVTAGYDNTARIWEGPMRQDPITLPSRMGDLLRVSFSVDGARVVALYRNKTMKIWDAKTGQELPRETKHPPLAPGAASVDGRYFAHVERERILIIDRRLQPEEREFRYFWTRPRPEFHRDEYLAALRAKDAFAARFHRERMGAPDAQFHFNEGELLEDIQDLDGAVAAYRRAIQLDSKMVAAHRKLVVALGETNDVDGALAAYRQAAAVDLLKTSDIEWHLSYS
jgi:WD40 repeat protein